MRETVPSVGIDLFDVHRLRLAEVDAPRLSPEEEAARDREWNKALRSNPCLFDGPVVGACDLSSLRPAPVPGNTSWLPSLFVNVVQPTDDGRVLVGRMSSSTAAPGRWQLAGGSMEPPAPNAALDEAAVRCHAARELVEETGVALEPERLRLRAVTRGEHRSIGVVFLLRIGRKGNCMSASRR